MTVLPIMPIMPIMPIFAHYVQFCGLSMGYHIHIPCCFHENWDFSFWPKTTQEIWTYCTPYSHYGHIKILNSKYLIQNIQGFCGSFDAQIFSLNNTFFKIGSSTNMLAYYDLWEAYNVLFFYFWPWLAIDPWPLASEIPLN